MKSGLVTSVLIISLMTTAVPSSAQQQTKSYQTTAFLLMGAATGTELILKDRISPPQPRWTAVNALDSHIRERLVWESAHLAAAAKFSDALFFGTAAVAALYVPLSGDHSLELLATQSAVVGVTSLMTNAVKIMVARQRPYAHYGTLASQGLDDNASFFSGHTSLTTAMAVSSAMLLAEGNGWQRSTALVAAGIVGATTAYFRIAADQHYFSDVLTGAIVGGVLAYWITEWTISNQNPFTEAEIQTPLLIHIRLPIGFSHSADDIRLSPRGVYK